MMRRILLAILLLAGCKGMTTAKDVADTAHPAGVWMASLRMVIQKRLANSVPAAFARDAVEAAIDDIDQCRKSIAQAPDAPKEIQTRALHALADANKAAEELKDALEKNDRAAIAAADRDLAVAQREFENLK